MKPFQGNLFRLFGNLILNLREEDISNTTNSEKLTKMEEKTGITDCAKSFDSEQECDVVNEKFRILNTVNRDVGSDDVRHIVDTRDIIPRVKPDLLSGLRSVAAGAA